MIKINDDKNYIYLCQRGLVPNKFSHAWLVGHVPADDCFKVVNFTFKFGYGQNSGHPVMRLNSLIKQVTGDQAIVVDKQRESGGLLHSAIGIPVSDEQIRRFNVLADGFEKDESLKYDLFAKDPYGNPDPSAFNCRTFAVHILNMIGIDCRKVLGLGERHLFHRVIHVTEVANRLIADGEPQGTFATEWGNVNIVQNGNLRILDCQGLTGQDDLETVIRTIQGQQLASAALSWGNIQDRSF